MDVFNNVVETLTAGNPAKKKRGSKIWRTFLKSKLAEEWPDVIPKIIGIKGIGYEFEAQYKEVRASGNSISESRNWVMHQMWVKYVL